MSTLRILCFTLLGLHHVSATALERLFYSPGERRQLENPSPSHAPAVRVRARIVHPDGRITLLTEDSPWPSTVRLDTVPVGDSSETPLLGKGSIAGPDGHLR